MPCRLWTLTLEIAVLMAAISVPRASPNYPTIYRTLGLGFANIGAPVDGLMGMPYDSAEGRALCRCH